LSEKKRQIIDHFDKLASTREKWIKKSGYYYRDVQNFMTFNIPPGATILEIGCGTGELLHSLRPQRGLGLDISPGMIRLAKDKFPDIEFMVMDGEQLALDETFDYVIMSDVLCYLEDVQKVFRQIKKVTTPCTRVILTYHSFLWQPFLELAEHMGLKMPQLRLNWLNQDDLMNLLAVEGYDIVKAGRRLLFPFNFPVISLLINRYVAFLPLLNRLCLTGFIISRILPESIPSFPEPSVSVVIPARNERGNIEEAIKRIPAMGSSMEIIFVEGHSQDGTLEEIRRVAEHYKNRYLIQYDVQEGIGKGDAVRKGFSMARGDILMILDADLTVPPEDLPKFYEAIAAGRGEFINGSRLVYPLEEQSMRTLNILGNKFFSLMFTWLLGQRLKDTLCGTKVISKRNYRNIVATRLYFGNFDPFGDFDLIFGAAKLNLKIVEIPIRYKSRRYGSTNISRFKHGWLLLKMVIFAMNKIKFI